MQLRMTLKLWSSCLCLPSFGNRGEYHYAQPFKVLISLSSQALLYVCLISIFPRLHVNQWFSFMVEHLHITHNAWTPSPVLHTKKRILMITFRVHLHNFHISVSLTISFLEGLFWGLRHGYLLGNHFQPASSPQFMTSKDVSRHFQVLHGEQIAPQSHYPKYMRTEGVT